MKIVRTFIHMLTDNTNKDVLKPQLRVKNVLCSSFRRKGGVCVQNDYFGVEIDSQIK